METDVASYKASTGENEMKFGLLTEGEVPKGLSYSVRYHEVIKEAVFAEEMGFDLWDIRNNISFLLLRGLDAGNALRGCCRANLEIKIRHMSVVMLRYNHPIRIAERWPRSIFYAREAGVGHGTVEQH